MWHKRPDIKVDKLGGNIRVLKGSRMLAYLTGGHADRKGGQRMRQCIRPDVLIIDDFAMRTASQSDDLVSDRAIADNPLILISNRAPKDVERVLAARWRAS